jgi:hypothetical protein
LIKTITTIKNLSSIVLVGAALVGVTKCTNDLIVYLKDLPLEVNSPGHQIPFIEGEVLEEGKDRYGGYELKVGYDEAGVKKSLTFKSSNEFEIDYLDTFYNRGDKVKIERSGIIERSGGCG